MTIRRIRAAVLAVSAALGLAACSTYGGYGSGYYGSGYAVSGGYYDGWYDNYYYPGRGVYVYDRGGRRHAMNPNQRRYWLDRARSPEDRAQVRRNYRDFRSDRRGDRTQLQVERRANREAFRSGQINREQLRSEQRGDRRAFRQERREDRRALQRDNRRAVRD